MGSEEKSQDEFTSIENTINTEQEESVCKTGVS